MNKQGLYIFGALFGALVLIVMMFSTFSLFYGAKRSASPPPIAPAGNMGAPGGDAAELHYEGSVQSLRQAPVQAKAAYDTAVVSPQMAESLRRASPPQFVPATADITLGVAGHYKEKGGEKAGSKEPVWYQPAYVADFKGVYVFRNDNEFPIRADLTFPFPPNVSSLTGTQILVDDKPVKNVDYKLNEASWTTRFPAGQTVKLVVTYTARGENSYYYELPSDSRLEHLKFAIKFTSDDMSPDDLEFPEGAMVPDNEQQEGPNTKVFSWDLENVVTRQNLGFVLPQKAGQAEKLDAISPLMSLSPMLLVLFLVLLLLAAGMKGAKIPVVAVPFLGIAFYLFYPFLVILAGLLPIGWALAIAAIVVGLMVVIFASKLSGGELGRNAVLLLVLLAFVLVPEAQLHPNYRGLLLIIGVLIIVAYYMKLASTWYANRPEEEEPPAPPWMPEEPLAEQPEVYGQAEREPVIEPSAPAAPVTEPSVEQVAHDHCVHCGREVEAGFTYCPACGQLAQAFANCPKCQVELCATCAPGYKFCPKCGQRLSQ